MTSERKFIAENIRRVLLKEYLMRKTERAGFGDLDIQRTPLGTRVTLIAERPGMVIGRKGGTIKELTRIVEDDFKFDNPQIEVQEAPNPSLNPQIMAQKLVSALERGWHFRRAGHSTVRQIMSAGAKGCQVIISGKLTGQRHRVEKFKQGHIKFCGEPKKTWMLEGFAVAKKKLGVIGVKVQIMDPNAKLPDEVDILSTNDIEAFIKNETEKIIAAREKEAELEKQASPIEIITEDEFSEKDTEEDEKDKQKEKKAKPKKKSVKTKDEEPEEKSAGEEEDVPKPDEDANLPKSESEQKPVSEPVAADGPSAQVAEEPGHGGETRSEGPSEPSEPSGPKTVMAAEPEVKAETPEEKLANAEAQSAKPVAVPKPATSSEVPEKPEENAEQGTGTDGKVPTAKEEEPKKEEKTDEIKEKDGVDA